MTTRELTSDELAELTERLKAGDPLALKEALAATKPPRAPKAPKVPADPRVTRIKRMATNVANLAERIDGTRRALPDAREEVRRKLAAGIPRVLISDDIHRASAEARLPGWQNDLSYQAGELARVIKSYFSA